VVFFKGDCRAHEMACHTSNRGGSMCHPSNAKAWKHFDRMNPDFVEEPHIGPLHRPFAPHNQYDHTYSCWSVIITPYNLPTGMCMSSEYMFLTMVIPGPSNPKQVSDRCVLETVDHRVVAVVACGC
ncbi:UNVERIFIED_CONTAM: hypothetical protein Scaly_3108100, partial [Sesamum calycinum]